MAEIKQELVTNAIKTRSMQKQASSMNGSIVEKEGEYQELKLVQDERILLNSKLHNCIARTGQQIKQ